jgi:hypothetical protein
MKICGVFTLGFIFVFILNSVLSLRISRSSMPHVVAASDSEEQNGSSRERDNTFSRPTGVQFMITNKMRSILHHDLNYLSEEVRIFVLFLFSPVHADEINNTLVFFCFFQIDVMEPKVVFPSIFSCVVLLFTIICFFSLLRLPQL